MDAENPARSELLSSTLRPHGTGKLKRPIFHGPNDGRYQVLSTWVNNLRAPGANEPVAQAGYAARRGQTAESFAIDRNGARQASGARRTIRSRSRPNSARSTRRGLPEPMPATRYVPGRGMVVESGPPSDDEFPAPFMLGGPKPKLKTQPAATPASETIPLPSTMTAPRAPDSDLPVLPEMPSTPAQPTANLPKPKA